MLFVSIDDYVRCAIYYIRNFNYYNYVIKIENVGPSIIDTCIIIITFIIWNIFADIEFQGKLEEKI